MFRWLGLWPVPRACARLHGLRRAALGRRAERARRSASGRSRTAPRAKACRRRCCTPSRSPRPGGREGGRLRPWPWAINREGKGYWFGSRDEALAFARASLAEGRPSFDVGCFQINYRYHGQNFPSLEAMFDPDTGAAYAAQFLRSLYRGDWSAAAGAYHSQTPTRASVYRARFDRILAGLGGAPLVVAAAAPEPPVQRRRRRPSRARAAPG